MQRVRGTISVALLTAFLAVPTEAQTVPTPLPEDIEPRGGQTTWISAVSFTGKHETDQTDLKASGVPGFYENIGPAAFFDAAVSLPAGASIGFIQCEAFETSTLNPVLVIYQKVSYNVATHASAIAFKHAGSSTSPGPNQFVTIMIPRPDRIIRYDEGLEHHLYYLSVRLDTGSRLRGCRLTWHRTVSPAPAFATFADVPVGHPLHRFVEAMAQAGLTGGCGDGANYCADQPVTRGQIAVFLATALGLQWP